MIRFLKGLKSAASVESIDQDWKPTHVHLKSGHEYRVVRVGLNEADLVPVVIYEDREAHVWVRPADEFIDGRFAHIKAQEASFILKMTSFLLGMHSARKKGGAA